MARTSTSKRKAPAKPVGGRSNKVAVLVRLPPELLEQIDALAGREERPRSKVIEFACRDYVQAHQRERAAA